jgi:hypothetical protein
MDFEVIQPGPGHLIRVMIDEIDLIPIINSTVRWDETQWNLSPGELIAAMLISCKPERIETFNYVVLLALLLYSLLERRVRQSLLADKEPFHVAGSYKTYRPSGKTILEELDYITIGVFRDSNGNHREIPANIERTLGRLVNLAGFDIKIYATPPCPVLRDG